MSEQAEYTYDVFISYSHADKAWVWNELLPRLEGAGLRACIDDRDFEPGQASLVNMENAVKRSRKTLIALTPAWARAEDKTRVASLSENRAARARGATIPGTNPSTPSRNR